MIKHEVRWQIASPYHPSLALKPALKREVNEGFLKPILIAFFNSVRISEYTPVDIDKLKTEIEFIDIDYTENFVQDYVYKEIFDDIHKVPENNKVQHTNKCIITFDKTLAWEPASVRYPGKAEPIRWGALRLGDVPILYYIWIDIQDLIDYTKRIKIQEIDENDLPKQNYLRNRQLHDAITVAINDLAKQPVSESIRQQISHLQQLRTNPDTLQGRRGVLNVNLNWHSTDDLDLHLTYIPTRQTISYLKKQLPIGNAIGILDVDANASQITTSPQENIYWEPDAPEGEYLLQVDFFHCRDQYKVPFIVKIIATDASSAIFVGAIDRTQRKLRIARFHYSRKHGVKILEKYI